MSQSQPKFLVLPQDYAPFMTQQEMQQHVQLQHKILESYVNRPEGQDDNQWIEQTISSLNPQADITEIKQGCADILETLHSMSETEDHRDLLQAKGVTNEALIASELFEKVKDMSQEEACAFLNAIAQQLNEDNKRSLNYFNTYTNLTPEQLADNTSNQYAVLAEIANFNARAEAEGSEFRAVLDESTSSADSPYGLVKIVNAQNETVDSMVIQYVEDSPAVDNSNTVLYEGLNRLQNSYDINNPEETPIGVNVDLPNGSQQGIFVDIPSYGKQENTKTRDGVFFKDKQERSPFADYIVYPENLKDDDSNPYNLWTGDIATNDTLFLAIEANNKLPQNFLQYLKQRVMDIAKAAANSVLFTCNNLYKSFSESKAAKVATLSTKAAKFLIEHLASGSLEVLKIVSALALKFGSFACDKLKNIDFIKSTAFAAHCVESCASTIDEALRSMSKVGAKTVNVTLDKTEQYKDYLYENQPLPQETFTVDLDDEPTDQKRNRNNAKSMIKIVAAIAKNGLKVIPALTGFGPILSAIIGGIVDIGTSILEDKAQESLKKQHQQQAEKQKSRQRKTRRGKNKYKHGQTNQAKTYAKGNYNRNRNYNNNNRNYNNNHNTNRNKSRQYQV